MRLPIISAIVSILFSSTVMATPEEEEKQFELEYEQKKQSSKEIIPNIVEKYALSLGCVFNMQKENVVELKNWEELSYLSLYSLDLGCSGGSAMSRPYFVVLSNYDRSHPEHIFVNPKYSLPSQTSGSFPQTITSVYTKNEKIYYTALEFDFAKDARCCPSVKIEGELVFEEGYWKPIPQKNRYQTKCSNPRTSRAGPFISRGFVVFLRKSNPQSQNLKAAVVHGVRLLSSPRKVDTSLLPNEGLENAKENEKQVQPLH
jgi:hypothetical protein